MKTLLRSLFAAIFLLSMGTLHGQNLKVKPDGVRIPMADHNAIVLQEEAQIVYDTVTNTIWYFDNAVWKEIGNELPENPTAGQMLFYGGQSWDLLEPGLHGQSLNLCKGVPTWGPCPQVQDIDGNIYDTIHIGDQAWLQQSLRVTKYNDGTPIPKVADANDWVNRTTHAYCWFENDSLSYFEHGALYNYFVAESVNPLNVCPVGWHVPSKIEMETLVANLGGATVAGGKVKEAGFVTWNSPNTGATNSSGMTLLGTGNRNHIASFINAGRLNAIWSKDTNPIYSILAPYYLQTYYTHSEFQLQNSTGIEELGLKIRCIED